MADAQGIGAFIRSRRERTGLSLSALARTSGISKSTLSTWERSLRQPCLPELDAVLEALQSSSEERVAALLLIDAPRARRALDDERAGFRPSLMAALRARIGMDQADLAAVLGVRQSSVSRWERGENEPSEELLRRFARIAGATLSEWKALTRPAPYGDGTTLDELEARFWRVSFDAPMPKDVEFLLLRRSLARAEGAQGRRLRARVAIRHTQCLAECGRTREAISAALDANALGRKERLDDGALLPAIIAEASVTRSPDRALRVLSVMSDKIDDPVLRAWLADERGHHLVRAGHGEEGAASVRQAMAIARAEARPNEQYLRSRGAARAFVTLGLLDEAARALEFERPPDLLPTTLDHVVRYEFAQAVHDEDSAARHYAAASTCAREEGRLLGFILSGTPEPLIPPDYSDSSASDTASFQSFAYPSA